MKKVFLLLSVAVLVLGLAFSAQAANIEPAPSGEVNLWAIINSWTSPGFVDENALDAAPAYSTIPSGAYKVIAYAGYAGFTQEFGDFDSTGAVPAKGAGFLKQVAGGFNSNITGVSIPFSQGNPVAFYDYADNYNYAITTNGSSRNGAGLIFDFTSFGYGYIIAFEDGNNNGLGDRDYNDFVAQVVTPIPGSLLLLGSGLIGVLGLRRKMVA